MKKIDFRFVLSVIVLYSTMAATAKAAPVQFNQVLQVVNAKPGKANTASFAHLRLNADEAVVGDGGDDETKKAVPAPPQDGRVITETRTEIVEDEVCDCVAPAVVGGFPYGWLALGAVPLVFLIPNDPDDPNDSSTPNPTPTPTTPIITPTPTPTPVPEPVTILLFGTGLAGIGLAARRKFGKKDEETER